MIEVVEREYTDKNSGDKKKPSTSPTSVTRRLGRWPLTIR